MNISITYQEVEHVQGKDEIMVRGGLTSMSQSNAESVFFSKEDY